MEILTGKKQEKDWIELLTDAIERRDKITPVVKSPLLTMAT